MCPDIHSCLHWLGPDLVASGKSQLGFAVGTTILLPGPGVLRCSAVPGGSQPLAGGQCVGILSRTTYNRRGPLGGRIAHDDGCSSALGWRGSQEEVSPGPFPGDS